MKIDILTLFPKVFTPLQESIIKRAQEKGLVEVNIHDLRKWSMDKHNTVDDKPYGGGAGMVIRVDVVHRAISNLQLSISNDKSTNLQPQIILLSPQGKRFTQAKAKQLSKLEHLILIAGHYEGFDERIREHLIDEEISIGDYVLTGGELPAMVVTDAIVRLIPEVVNPNSLIGETHSSRTQDLGSLPAQAGSISNIKHPVYTRPEKHNDWEVPKVLLSGNHAEISKWKKRNEK